MAGQPSIDQDLRYGELDQIHILITDSGLPQSQEHDLQDAGLRVIRA